MAKTQTTNNRYRALHGLTVASLKMYFRNRTALMFSLFFPIFFIFIFGSIFRNTAGSYKIDLVNQSHSQLAGELTGVMHKVDAFKITNVDQATGKSDLDKGNADLLVVVPPNFGQMRSGQMTPSGVETFYNSAKPQNGQAANLILTQLVGNINAGLTRQPQVVTITAKGVATKNLSYIDFLLPGMVSLSIMQLGIFSVAFAFVSFKTTGMLRRIQATPTRPGYFLTAQGATRLVVAVMQTVLLVFIGAALFGFHLSNESWLPFLTLAIIGSIVFMGIGFIIAGWAKNEDQAQPVATLIQFPMMFLSGVFFPRDSFPHVLNSITNYLPLTFLADALRKVANEGANLWAVRGDLLGLAIWGIVAYAAAVMVFSWE